MHPPIFSAAGHFVQICPICRLPVSDSTRAARRCLCLPSAYECWNCHAIRPFRESNVRKMGRDGHWDWKRSYLCARCRDNKAQAKAYKRNKANVASADWGCARRIQTHPLHKWAVRARTEASRQEYLAPTQSPALQRYNLDWVRILRAYADRLDRAALNREDYLKAGRGSYPDDLQPTIPLIRERIPLRDRALLFEVAVSCGLKHLRSTWAAINRANRT